MNRDHFRPSADLIRAAENLLVAMAHEDLVRPVVQAYESAILAKHQFPPAQEWRGYVQASAILDRKSAFLLSDVDHKVYLRECFAARDAAGLKVREPDNCPLLEAESLRIEAEAALIEQLGHIEGLDALKTGISVLSLEQRARAVDIGLRLVAPFVSDAQDVLQRLLRGDRCAA